MKKVFSRCIEVNRVTLVVGEGCYTPGLVAAEEKLRGGTQLCCWLESQC